MTKSVKEQVQAMLKEIQAGREDPLEAGNHHTPTLDTPAENALPAAEDTEPVHVFFVRESEVRQALLDAQSVEAGAETKQTPQSVTPTPTSTNTATRNNMVLSVGIFTICVLISILLLLLLIVPQFVTPVATVAIIPVEKTITTTKAITVQGRALPALTLTQSISAPATGKRHQTANQAQGSITFFNGLYISQTVASGTILTGQDGVQVITDQPAVIPAANPPGLGQTTISAHAQDAGAQGDIPAGDINQQCCLTAVKAVNTEAFTGGQNAREYLVVTKADIDQAEAPLTANLAKSEQAALQAQLQPNEQLFSPPCREQVTSDHRPGEEAREVTVTLSQTCSAVAYPASDLRHQASAIIDQEAIHRLGTGYISFGDTHVTIIHVKIIDQARGIATLSVKSDATYGYQISPGEKQQLVHLIAGKTRQQAHVILLQLPGIAGAAITTKGNAATLPENPGSITILVVQRV